MGRKLRDKPAKNENKENRLGRNRGRKAASNSCVPYGVIGAEKKERRIPIISCRKKQRTGSPSDIMEINIGDTMARASEERYISGDQDFFPR